MDITMLKDLVGLMKMLEEPKEQPKAPATEPQQPVALNSVVEGALRRFGSGVLLGDLRVGSVPRGIKWRVHKNKNGAESLESPTIWRGIGNIGPHGRCWVTDLVDTGVSYAAAVASDDADFEAALAAAKADAADAAKAAASDAAEANAEDAPTV